MELHSSARLKRVYSSSPLCERYLDRLQLQPDARRTAAAAIDAAAATDEAEALTALHEALAGSPGQADNPAFASVPVRAALASGVSNAKLTTEPADTQQQNTPGIAPPPSRQSMIPHPWTPLNPLKRWANALMRQRRHWVERRHDGAARKAWPAALPEAAHHDVVDAPDPRGRWQHQGNIRRLVLLVLMLSQTAAATWFMSQVLPYQGGTRLEMAVLTLFAVLFCWVSAGFWTAMAGFLVILRGRDTFMISRRDVADAPIAAGARTAIVMPICNEDVIRVMAGLRATYESVLKTGDIERFDFFILSDSNDPDTCVAELDAWRGLCQAVDGFGRIFYRRRRRRVKRKSGNIDDFCRRWGSNYRYMIVLDADSVMSGDCLTTLVKMMEGNPGAGIIQTAPSAAGRDTLYARIQQFSTRVYGPLFTAGLHYWQLGESHYWGHNAIIRMAPFIRHCALAPLPGRGSLAGEILSHDFVEAALMRRAGWAVWIAYDLEGSYEEMPPNLLDELKRDRRWCHGNLMNFRLFTARGMHRVHRAVFVTGVMAYLSAPLWLLFLALSTGMLAIHTLVEPQYFVAPRQLFPIWPQWHPEKALALFSATATILFLPKILSVLLIASHGAELFGGKFRLTVSMLIELLFSMLLAPVRMLFHTVFVTAAFLGWEMRWNSPPREDSETTWGEAFRKHGLHMVFGLAWGVVVYFLNPSFLWWLLPIAGALALSAPLSVLSSRVSLGRSFRRAKLFLIPEEAEPPTELKATYDYAKATSSTPDFVDAVVDPLLNAVVCSGARAHPRLPSSARTERSVLADTALREGPATLQPAQYRVLLDDPLALSQLHFKVWSSALAHPEWRDRIYRVVPEMPESEPLAKTP
ncbi:glucans biosynthesis glucosyltransferase MdoH [Noviherbaspirillum saxi]|uniref:Glucans biosynthesis glucosyltransferase H n=1 Tax=Noviherbaspirillum saxi TaxID=2320863 RepID=A0A3A3FWH6_9BURK|nr:glucans biosynthesis glucosyltransferase MdoH [Noviherbaspirillum saxi]RJF98511.1 glucans biosynthesis glucosyltransferase MdoH [Noviherbaspirillum saxi]